jgi:TetR/AcrR family transcriptional regulator, regulator of autoinduction and epiphytic fitness
MQGVGPTTLYCCADLPLHIAMPTTRPTTRSLAKAGTQLAQAAPAKSARTASLRAAATRQSVADAVKASAKPSFKQQMLRAREAAIIDVVNRMLADKGFDAMTVDEVAAEVGIAKASLYKHFPSKEDLAAAAMVRMMQRAQDFLAHVDAKLSALDKLKASAHWMMQLKLAGEMPNLPSQNSSLRTTLTGHTDYVDGLLHISDTLGGWIEAAQAAGQINAQLPALVVLYTLYARACDPVLEFLKLGNQHSDAQIIALVMQTCFEGLHAR